MKWQEVRKHEARGDIEYCERCLRKHPHRMVKFSGRYYRFVGPHLVRVADTWREADEPAD